MNLGRMSGDLPQMVSSGELTCYLSTVRFTQWVPEIAVIDLPFIVKDRKTIQNAFSNRFGNFLKNAFMSLLHFISWAFGIIALGILQTV